MGSIQDIFDQAFGNVKGIFDGSLDLVDSVLGGATGSLGGDDN